MADNEMTFGIEEAIESAQKKISAKKEIKFDIQISKKKIEESVEQLKQTFSGLDKKVANVANGIKKAMDGVGSHIKSAFSGIGDEINNAFTVTNMQEHAAAAARFGDDLADSLLSLDKNMGALEDSVVDIIAPLAGVVVPIFNDALSAITGLARGAVLPANRPFLALVGDQRHGTNVEAPLATIQEAVSLVMQQQSARLERGLDRSIQVQSQILEAVLGIEIGESVIAQAAERYRNKMAMVQGGYV